MSLNFEASNHIFQCFDQLKRFKFSFPALSSCATTVIFFIMRLSWRTNVIKSFSKWLANPELERRSTNCSIWIRCPKLWDPQQHDEKMCLPPKTDKGQGLVDHPTLSCTFSTVLYQSVSCCFMTWLFLPCHVWLVRFQSLRMGCWLYLATAVVASGVSWSDARGEDSRPWGGWSGRCLVDSAGVSGHGSRFLGDLGMVLSWFVAWSFYTLLSLCSVNFCKFDSVKWESRPQTLTKWQARAVPHENRITIQKK